MKRRIMAIFLSILALLAAVAIAAAIFLNSPGFGRLPQGARLERIKQSPNYRDGQFHNLQPTTVMAAKQQNTLKAMWRFLTEKQPGIVPEQPVEVAKHDLKHLPADSNLIVWFGHSSYMLQLSGRRFLVDPVFYKASPVSFVNKPFPGTDVFKPSDLPDHIDYLVITHDHWDHLDHQTAVELKSRIDRVICPLGVGEHFERWGYLPTQLVELDWNECATLAQGFMVHCLPARHFSGRGLKRNHSLWASFMLATPSLNVYVGGDSGYGSHFKAIGMQFPDIDVAILENGQYNEDWRYIHTLPNQLGQVAKDLGAKQIITVHHSKYALARHPWDEPLTNEQTAATQQALNLKVLKIGQPTSL